MNISVNEFEAVEHAVSFRSGSSTRSASSTSRKNQTFGRRKKGPQQFNGIHRRRKKKIRW